MSRDDQIRAQFEEAIEVKRRSLSLIEAVGNTADLLITAVRAGHKVLVCGNGGSAADAQHFAAELVGRFERERAALPAVALTTDSSILTAWSNDYGYRTVFARQVMALGVPGDVLVGISTSGNSPSVICAMEEAHRRGLRLVALTGRGGGALAAMPGVCSVIVPADQVSRIQEVHITIIHIWVRLLEDAMQ
ncbi:MAG: D-sedoheptulose-7-phosphate isomerase [Vicinamibacterales bacterium]